MPYLFILPSALFMLLVFLYPLYLTFKYSFFQISMLSPESQFIGFKNFLDLFTKYDFVNVCKRTIIWTISSVFIKASVGLILALLLSKEIRGIKIYRVLVLIPWAMPQSISAITWAWIYDGNYGYLNYFLEKFGFISQNLSWLGERKLAFISTLMMDAWAGIPFMALVLLAGLQAIPESIYEAAEVDGANRFNKFFLITLPQLRNVIFVATMLSFIWTFNSFNIIWVLTKGGPVDATETIIIKIYRQAFGRFDIGVSSAMSVIVFLILMTFTFIYWKIVSTDDL